MVSTCVKSAVADSAHLQASQASAELRRNLEQEENFCTQFLVSVDAEISPLQLAQCYVASWPWMPDALAMTNVLGALSLPKLVIYFFPFPAVHTYSP